MLIILCLLASLPVLANAGQACSVNDHFDLACDECRKEKACADIYHIEHFATGSCSDTDKVNYRAMFRHLYMDRAYGLPNDANVKVKFCDIDNYNGDDPLLLYYMYGPSCNDGETFEMYPGGQSGFCYCGSDCDKSYSNPPMNTLLTSLVIVIGINILFNVILLFYRYRGNRQGPKNVINTTGSRMIKRTNPAGYL